MAMYLWLHLRIERKRVKTAAASSQINTFYIIYQVADVGCLHSFILHFKLDFTSELIIERD